jgi:hypothetical protein
MREEGDEYIKVLTVLGKKYTVQEDKVHTVSSLLSRSASSRTNCTNYQASSRNGSNSSSTASSAKMPLRR